MKNYEVFNIINKGIFNKLKGIKMKTEKDTFLFGRKLNKIADDFNKIIDEDKAIRQSIIDKYGEEGRVKPEHIDLANDIINEFMNTDVSFNYDKIDIDKLLSSELTASDYALIDFLFTNE